MYRVYCLNYILKESQVNLKNTNFGTSLLPYNQLFLQWVQIMTYFKTHCKSLKFMIRDMFFPTKLTPLINTRGLIDSASLKNHHNNRHNSGSHKWPNTFWAVYIYLHDDRDGVFRILGRGTFYSCKLTPLEGPDKQRLLQLPMLTSSNRNISALRYWLLCG